MNTTDLMLCYQGGLGSTVYISLYSQKDLLKRFAHQKTQDWECEPKIKKKGPTSSQCF